MRAVVQRVSSASVAIDGLVVGAIGRGLLVLVGVGQGDTATDAEYIVEKVANLRIFPDGDGRFDRSVIDEALELLVVSQFTLYGDTRKGRRPSFQGAAAPTEASTLFEELLERFRARGLPVANGRFQAAMEVSLVNDGPVTIIIDSDARPGRHRKRGQSEKGVVLPTLDE